MAKKYRVTVEAMQVPVFKDLDGLEKFKDDFKRVADWSGGMEKWSRLRPIALDIRVTDGPGIGWIAEEGDWVVKIGDHLIVAPPAFTTALDPVISYPE